MKRIIATLLATAVLMAIPLTPAAKSNVPALMLSVKPLQWITVNDESRPKLGIHCTVSLINDVKHYWLTAAHCVDGDDESNPAVAERDFFIDGKEADVIATSFPNDLAILQTRDSNSPALRLAPLAPAYLDPVTMSGYPYGLGPVITVGHVMNPAMSVGSGLYMTLSIAGCPGNSGSSVVNAEGQVIGVLQVGIGAPQGGCAALMGASPYLTLRAFAYAYFIEGMTQ